MKKENTKNRNKSKSDVIKYNRKRLLTNDTPFAIKEAYIKLRTNLMFCMTADKQHLCKIFGVTSSKPSEGKSLTAANIAISFAMLGKKTLLVDCDMRKPTQRRIWRIGTVDGLCDFLADIKPLQFMNVNELPLTIVCTGTIPPNPSELLASDRMKQFVNACKNTYDYIIIDTPPINTVADAQIISTFVDGMILVAKSGNTTGDELNMAIDAIKRADGNICGVVLNDLNSKSVKSSYRYNYSDKYGYKYSYKNYYSDAYETKNESDKPEA